MPPLEITPEEFHRLADEVVHLCAGYLETLRTRPAYPRTSGAETARLFTQPWPEMGLRQRALTELSAVIEHSRPPGPRFFGYVFGSGDPVGDAVVEEVLAAAGAGPREQSS